MELGAGGGLPSIVTALNGARKVSRKPNRSLSRSIDLTVLCIFQVVVTDYPDAALIDNLNLNVKQNVPENIIQIVDVKASRFVNSIMLVFAYPSSELGVYLGSESGTVARVYIEIGCGVVDRI